MAISFKVRLNGELACEDKFPSLSMRYGSFYVLKESILNCRVDSCNEKEFNGSCLIEYSHWNCNDEFTYEQCGAILAYLKALINPEKQKNFIIFNKYYYNLFEQFVSFVQSVVDYGNRDNIKLVYC